MGRTQQTGVKLVVEGFDAFVLQLTKATEALEAFSKSVANTASATSKLTTGGSAAGFNAVAAGATQAGQAVTGLGTSMAQAGAGVAGLAPNLSKVNGVMMDLGAVAQTVAVGWKPAIEDLSSGFKRLGYDVGETDGTLMGFAASMANATAVFPATAQNVGQVDSAVTHLSVSAQELANNWQLYTKNDPKLNNEQWERFAEQVNKLNASAPDLGRQIDAVAASIRGENKALDESAQKYDLNSAAVHRFAMGLAALGAAGLATASGMGTITSRIEELEAVLGVTTENAHKLREAEGDYAAAAGLTAQAVQKEVESVRELHLAGTVANEMVAQLIRYNLDWTRANEMARLAQDAAVFAMQDSTKAAEGLINGIITLQPRVLRTYGLLINLDVAYEKYAKANGLAAESLSVAQRQQAAFNEVLSQAPQVAGAYEASMTTFAKQFRSLKTDTINLSEAYGSGLTPVLDEGIGVLRKTIQVLVEFPQPIRETITVMGTMTSAVALFGGTALRILPSVASAVRDLERAWKGLAIAQTLGAGTLGALAGFATFIAGIATTLVYMAEYQKAQKETAATILATSDTYPEYIAMMKDAEVAAYGLTQQLWEQVKAMDATQQEEMAKELKNVEQDLLTLADAALAFTEQWSGIDTATGGTAAQLELNRQAAEAFAAQLRQMIPDMDEATLLYISQEDALKKLFSMFHLAPQEANALIDSILGSAEAYKEATAWGETYTGWLREHDTVVKNAITRGIDYTEQMNTFSLAEQQLSDRKAEAIAVAREQEIANYKLLQSLEPLAEEYGISMEALEALADVDMDTSEIEDYIEAVKDMALAFGASTNAMLEFATAAGLSMEQITWATDMREAQQDRNEDLTDLDIDYHRKSRDAWTDYIRELADIDGQIAQFHAGTLDDLVDLDREAAQDRADAWKEYQQDLADSEREFQQDLADLATDRARKVEDAERGYAQDLEDAARDRLEKLADLELEYQQDLEDAAKDRAQKLLDAEKDYQQELTDLNRETQQDILDTQKEYGTKREELAQDLARDLKDLERDHAQDMSDLRQQQRDDDAQAARDYYQELTDLEADFAEKRQDIADQYSVEAYMEQQAEEQRDQRRQQLLRTLAMMEQQQSPDQGRKAELEEELRSLEAIAQEKLAAERETAIAGVRAQFAAEQQERNAAHAKQLADAEAQYLESRQQRRDQYAQDLADLEIELAQELQAISDNLAQRMAELQLALQQEREEIQLDYQQRLDDLKLQLEREKAEIETDYGRRTEELKLQLEREREEIQLDYEQRLTDLQTAHANEKAEIDRRYAERMTDLQTQYDAEKQEIIDKLEEQRQAAKDKYDEQIADLKTWYSDRLEDIKTEYGRQRDEINHQLGLTVTAAADKFQELPAKMVETYNNMLSDVPVYLGPVVSAIIAEFQRIFDWAGAHSPAQRFVDLGRDITKGLEMGLTSDPNLISDALDIEAMTANLQAAMGKIDLSAVAAMPPQRVVIPPLPAPTGDKTVNNNLSVSASYSRFQSESSLRDDLAMYSMMMGMRQ